MAEGRAGHSTVTTVSVITTWYVVNIGLLLLNKFLLSGGSGFRAACFLSLCHMLACVIMGGLVALSGFMPLARIRSQSQLLKIFVLSCIFCSTIALGNASLKYIPVSFNQAIGSTTPFFTAIFALLCQGHREAFITYLTLVPIVGGIAIASGGEPMFHLMGFIFCLAATAGRALKTVVQAMLMADPADKMDPMSLLMYMSMFCCVILLPPTLYFEPGAFEQAWDLLNNRPGFMWWLISNSMLAYFVNLFNFLVTKLTSALTLQVLGNAKGVVAAIVSVMVFANPVTAMGSVGYAITVTGVFLYSETKRRIKAAKDASKPPGSEREPLLPPESPLLGRNMWGNADLAQNSVGVSTGTKTDVVFRQVPPSSNV